MKHKLRVIAPTFDSLHWNFKVGNNLGARLDAVNLKTSFPHSITGNDVYIFLNPSNCLKLVCNTLGSKGSIFDANKHIIDWNYIPKLERTQQEQGVLAVMKIRNRHIQ